MNSFVRRCVVQDHSSSVAFALLSLALAPECAAQTANAKAADKFKNVSVLDGIPADHMGKVMNIMSEALGVSCKHCHQEYDFAREQVAKKDKAREMLNMTLSLNKDRFGGRPVVSCVTCHQGHVTPPSASLSATAFVKTDASGFSPVQIIASEAHTINPSEVFRKYQAAIHDPTQKTTATLTWKAIRIEPNGKEEPEEVTVIPNASWEQVTLYGKIAIVERFRDGQVIKSAGSLPIELKSDEIAHIRIEAWLALASPLEPLFKNWTALPLVLIEDREMAVLEASEDDTVHRFYFDHQTGLLRRRTASLPTILGAHVVEVEYSDYAVVAGSIRPRQIRFHMPGVHWERRIMAMRR